MIALMVSSELLQAGIARGLAEIIARYHAGWARDLATVDAQLALRNILKIELNPSALQRLHDVDISYVLSETRAVRAGVLAELMVRDYQLRVRVLTLGTHSKVTEREADRLMTMVANESLRDISEGKIVLDDSDALLRHYALQLGEDDACQEFICGSMVWQQPHVLELMEKHGTNMTEEDVRQRFRQRWLQAKYRFHHTIAFLDEIPLSQLELQIIQEADLQVDQRISSAVIIPKFGHTISPGLVVLAKTYEFAARVFALWKMEAKVGYALSNIINMNLAPDDNIIMKVSTSEDSYPLQLDKNSLDEIVALYLQQIETQPPPMSLLRKLFSELQNKR